MRIKVKYEESFHSKHKMSLEVFLVFRKKCGNVNNYIRITEQLNQSRNSSQIRGSGKSHNPGSFPLASLQTLLKYYINK